MVPNSQTLNRQHSIVKANREQTSFIAMLVDLITCKVSHTWVRRILPEDTSFDEFAQQDIQCMVLHIYSYGRKKLNN